MFRESNWEREIAVEQRVLRHPDGSIDFDAYRQKACRARNAAIASSIRAAISRVAGVFAGRVAPSAKHQAT